VRSLDEDEFDAPLSPNDEISLEVNPEHRMVVKENKYRRENRRLRNSLSFRIGILLTNSLKRPWMVLLLPFTLVILWWRYINERLGRHSLPYPDHSLHDIEGNNPLRNCVILFPTNGVGFGHFTRMYALARRLKKKSPDLEIVFFTTMPTLQILYNDGFATYHLAGRKKHHQMTASEWNAMIEENLSLIFNQHKPKIFIFDGAYPYRGMLNSIRSQHRMQKIWLRRGMFKKGSNIPVDSIQHFTSIVHPGDGVNIDDHLGIDVEIESHSVEPMLLMDKGDLLPRKKALSRLNLSQEGKVVYIQLGAGRINDIDSEVRLTVEALLRYENLQIVIGESMLGERIYFDHPRVQLLRDYPNSMYFNAFDASVQAGGYNSFHEMRTFGIPTLFYPNMKTGMDDQLARCAVAKSEGWGIVLGHREKKSIERAVGDLLALEKVLQGAEAVNGAEQLADIIINKME
jgi:UDP-N-acetylglucosamine--N-acetylmuramyl-(pentapeptide) pyrophosphoryl-undecaprenol N-acetylglucosamine transferase